MLVSVINLLVWQGILKNLLKNEAKTPGNRNFMLQKNSENSLNWVRQARRKN